MRRTLVSFALALMSPALWAQSYNPEIAYAAASGKAMAIYLANRDGSHIVKVYQGPAKGTLAEPELSPQGNALAFVENGKLRLLPIVVTASGITPGSAQTLVSSVGSGGDFSPDGTMLAYQSTNGGDVRIIDLLGMDDVLLAQGVGLYPRWLCSGDIVVVEADIVGATYHVKRIAISESGPVVTPLFTTNLWDFAWDTARTREAILYRGTPPGGPTSGVYEYDIATGTFVRRLSSAGDFAFAPDDSEIVYTSSAKRSSGMYRLAIANGQATKIGTATGAVDWVPDAGGGCGA